MSLLNSADAVYLGSTPVTKVYQDGVEVWPGVRNFVTAQLQLRDINGPDMRITATTSGDITPSFYRYRYRIDGGEWIYLGRTSQTSFDFVGTWDADIQARVNTFDANDDLLAIGLSNIVTVGSEPAPVTEQRVWTGQAVRTSTYYDANGTWQRRTDNDLCYYGRYSSVWNNQIGHARWSIPNEIRNCVSVDKVELLWWNDHHYLGSGGKVYLTAHWNSSMNTYDGQSHPLRINGVEKQWSAERDAYIGGGWIDLSSANSYGRYNIKTEIRSYGLQGFGVYWVSSSQSGYGYAFGGVGDNKLRLRITYTVYV